MDAVRAALENHPNVIIAKQSLRSNRGAVQSAQGVFDWSLSANVGHVQSANGGDVNILSQDFDITNQQDITSMGASVSKLLPWGMTVSSGADFSRSQIGQVVTATLGSSNETDTTTPLVGTLFVNITQPLLQGLGSVTTAELRAREAELLAAKDDYQQTINNQLLQVVQAYWAYASAFAFLRAAREAEGRALKLLEDNKKLVQADLRPAAELRQLEANYADVKQALYRSEQSLVSARFTLGVAMGIDAKNASRLADPSTQMPQPPKLETIQLANEKIVESAYENRTDLLALAKRVSAAKLRLELAENTRIPQLDLSARIQYAGVGSDDEYRSMSIQNALTAQLGYTASLNLAFLWPPQMNAADGVIAQQAASLRIAQESQRSLRQQIGASVYSAIERLKQRARIAYEANRAESYYKESVSNEEKKLKAGLSTLVSLVLTQERLATAQSNAVAAMQAYAEAILAFRYSTGALIRKGKNSGQISPAYLLEFPKESTK